jgi:hypothetical protein
MEETYRPVPGTGKELTCAAANDTQSQAGLTAGALYEVTAHNGTLIVGVVDPQTAANVLKVIPAGQSRTFIMPGGYTTLYYYTPTGTDIEGWLVELHK